MYIVQEAMSQSRSPLFRRAGLAANREGEPEVATPQETSVEIDALDTPCLLIDLGKLGANIRRMADLASSAGVRLRPHAKTHKLIQVAQQQLAAGCDGLTVAKLGEAELLADHGIDDLFVAYPLWGVGKWDRLCRLAERADIRVGADYTRCSKGFRRPPSHAGSRFRSASSSTPASAAAACRAPTRRRC
jgi:D-serine deaminase-like pyridoxal phosphate-dependent protein